MQEPIVENRTHVRQDRSLPRQTLWHGVDVDRACEDPQVSRAKGKPTLSIEQKVRVVLSVLAGEITMAEAARRHGVSHAVVAKWRDQFIAAGRAGLEEKLPGPSGMSVTERRLRVEAEQLKLALAEATVQLRIWQKGAELADQIPSETSRP